MLRSLRFSGFTKLTFIAAVVGCLGLGLGGCSVGTTYVTLPTVLLPPPPDLGEAVSVQVKDGRAELSASQVGVKTSFGVKTGDVVLSDNESLADRVAKELVAILRERGYRAFDNLPIREADFAVFAEIATFFVRDRLLTAEQEGFAVVRARAGNPSGRVLLDDIIIRAEHRRTDPGAVVTVDYQEVTKGLYSEMLKTLRDNIPRAFQR